MHKIMHTSVHMIQSLVVSGGGIHGPQGDPAACVPGAYACTLPGQTVGSSYGESEAHGLLAWHTCLFHLEQAQSLSLQESAS